MSIIRIQHDKEKPYVMLNKASLQDPLLSWEAKGLWSYLLSLPDNWQVSVSHLSKLYCGDNKRGGGEKAIYSIISELISNGYMYVDQKKEKGKFSKVDYTVFESKQPVQQGKKKKEKTEEKPKTEENSEIKEILPQPSLRRAVLRRARLEGQTINNDKDDLSKRDDKDINVLCDRSFDKSSSTVSFDAETYIFPDGSKISQRMKNCIAKYSPKDREKLRANIFYLESQIEKGIKPKESYEQWLQGCIKYDYAAKDDLAERNRMYALFMRDVHNLRGIGVMKTVVKLNNFTNEPPKSITLSLPHDSFCDIIDLYVQSEQNKG